MSESEQAAATKVSTGEHTPQTCSGCLALLLLDRAERAEATLRDWGIEPNAEVDQQFRRDLAAINKAEGRASHLSMEARTT